MHFTTKILLLPSLFCCVMLLGCHYSKSPSLSFDLPSNQVEQPSSMGEGSISSQDTSLNSALSSEEIITPFDAPNNVTINAGILSFDAVEDALNGYEIKYYLQNQENNYEIIKTKETTLDLFNQNISKRGIVEFRVHVVATDKHYVSPYSAPVTLLMGVHENAVQAFLSAVKALNIITADSENSLTLAKSSYNALDEVDLLDERVKESLAILTQKETDYLTILIDKISLTKVENQTQDWLNLVLKARTFYESMLDKTSNVVNELLARPVSYDFHYNTYAISILENITTIDLNATNILNEKVVVDGLKVLNGEEELPLATFEGNFYVKHTQNINVYLLEDLLFTSDFIHPLAHEINALTGNKIININYEGEKEKVLVKAYHSRDVKLQEDIPLIFNNPLSVYETKALNISYKELQQFFLKQGILENTEISLVFALQSGEALTSYKVSSRYLNLKLVSAELKLDNPYEVYNEPIYFTSEGAIEYKWEILTNNEEYNAHFAKGIQFDFYVDEAFNEEETEIVSSILVTNPGHLTYQNIIMQLKIDHVEINEPLKAVAKMVASEETNLLDSDYVEVDGNYEYQVDYSLERYGEDNFNVDQNNGRLIWPWEIFQNNANFEADFIDYMEVLVFNGDETDINAQPLFTFEVNYIEGDRFTYKENIEHHLSMENLPSGSYRFSARLIAKPDSGYQNSKLYPLTEAYNYQVIPLSEVNVAQGTKARATYGDASKLVDGNDNERWININSEGQTSNNAFVIIDLLKEFNLRKIDILWEGAYAKNYEVFVESEIDFASFNGDTSGLISVYHVSDRLAYLDIDHINLNAVTGRYIIIKCNEMGTVYPYSIFEVKAYVDVK